MLGLEALLAREMGTADLLAMATGFGAIERAGDWARRAALRAAEACEVERMEILEDFCIFLVCFGIRDLQEIATGAALG